MAGQLMIESLFAQVPLAERPSSLRSANSISVNEILDVIENDPVIMKLLEAKVARFELALGIFFICSFLAWRRGNKAISLLVRPAVNASRSD